MKKFTEWVGVIRQAEINEASELQKSYQDYFKSKLDKFGAKSPAELSEDDKKKFFNEISTEWEKGKGLKDGVKEGVVFGINESHFKVGDRVKCKDSGKMGEVIKLDKEHGADDEKYYAVKVDGGEEMKYAPKDLALMESINESETADSLTSFLNKERKHFATFLKPKSMSVSNSGGVVTIKPASGSFTITVDFNKSTIDSTGKPSTSESTSYVEIIEYIKKHTKFKVLNESIDEAAMSRKEELEANLKSAEEKLRKYKGVRQNSIHPFDPQKKVSDYVKYLEGSIRYIKDALSKVDESFVIDEADIKSAEEFKKFAEDKLKKVHGDDYDETKAAEVIKGLSDEAEKSGDWGAAVGKLNKA
jgi:hypothetical protein